MLTEIHIRHLATIEEVHLELPAGTIVVTGETGAGKSIIMEAIELALGERASTSIIRKDHDKAEISLNFVIEQNTEVCSWLKENDFHVHSNECIIRRVIYADGRSRSYINGVPSTQQAVREVGHLLLHIHGQFEQHALLKSEKQRDILDHYADHEPLVAEVYNYARQALELQEALTTFTDQINEAKQHNEFLHFQLSELEALHLQPGEWESLDREQKKLANAEELLHHLHQVLHHLTDTEEHNVSRLLHESLKSLQAVQSVENKTTSWMQALNTALVQIQDTEQELRNYLEQVNMDPEQLQHVEQRIQQIYMIARKYKTQPEMLLNLQQELQHQLGDSALSEQRLAELREKLQDATSSYQQSAKKLSSSRTKAAKKLAQEVTQIIQTLSLPHGEMHIELTPETTALSAHGLEKVYFQIKTNPGQPLQLLAKVASGGELSRISLAIHLVTASKYHIPALVFDEVDTGISGAIAEKVGKSLRRLGESCQVLCVTHLPQVAAQGHHHLFVQKTVRDKASFTQIDLLNQKEKTQEIARMLSGEKITDAVLEHAREMLAVE